MGLDRMAKRQIAVQLVLIAPTDSLPLQIPGVYKVGDDRLCRPLGDADALGHVSQPERLIMRQAEQNMAVVREKRPRRPFAISD